MGTYIPFTEQQREQARMTDLTAFLERCGETLKRSGSEQMWLDHGQKVTIRGNLWFHQYEQVGGDAIDFARRFYGMVYPETVQLMLSMGVPPRSIHARAMAENCPVGATTHGQRKTPAARHYSGQQRRKTHHRTGGF